MGGTNPVQTPIVINALDSFGRFSVQLANTSIIDQQSAQPEWQFWFCRQSGHPAPGVVLHDSPGPRVESGHLGPDQGPSCTATGGGNQPSLNCDGVDDTIRLQAAISAGGTVTLPTGTCVVSGTGTMLTLVSNLAIVGQGMGVSTIKVKSANGDYDNILGPTLMCYLPTSASPT